MTENKQYQIGFEKLNNGIDLILWFKMKTNRPVEFLLTPKFE